MPTDFSSLSTFNPLNHSIKADASKQGLGIFDTQNITRTSFSSVQNNEKGYLDKMQESATNEADGQSIDRDVENGGGSVVWKKGNKEISQGEDIPREDLKKLGDLQSTTVNSHEVNYMEKDGKFIIFKDDSNLTYYYNGAETGRFNHYVANATQFASHYYSPFATGRLGKLGLDKISPSKNLTDKLNNSLGKLGVAYGVHQAETHTPIAGDIIGTPVPEAGEKEIILYLSDDEGETWNGKVYFDVDKHGNAKPNNFSDK